MLACTGERFQSLMDNLEKFRVHLAAGPAEKSDEPDHV